MNYGIILAAGNGVRLGIKDPIKPLVLVKNKPIFLHSLIVFTQNKNIDEIVLVVNKKYHNQYLKYLTKFVKPIHVVDGSNVARHLSLSLAVQFFQNEKHLQSNDVIVTHDAARINVSNELINLSIQVAKKYGCASTVLPLYDSLCEINNKSVYLDRANKYLVQTPQTFQFKY
jgi:2-C-methyl-D-erythritol 4-phosphate cytidylyltransferase